MKAILMEIARETPHQNIANMPIIIVPFLFFKK